MLYVFLTCIKSNLCQTFVSSLSSRMSPCPAPLTILWRSLATSSSSSPIGLNLGRRALQIHQGSGSQTNCLSISHSSLRCWRIADISVKMKSHLGLTKKRYWMRTVIMKKTTPSTAMANRFFPTMSHSRGERKRFSPVKEKWPNPGVKMRLSFRRLFSHYCYVHMDEEINDQAI